MDLNFSYVLEMYDELFKEKEKIVELIIKYDHTTEKIRDLEQKLKVVDKRIKKLLEAKVDVSFMLRKIN